MILISANPHHFRAPKRKTATTGRKAAMKGAKMAKKRHRSAAQKAATVRMLAANKRRKRSTSHNPAPRRAVRRRRAATKHNPVRYHRTRRRVSHNPRLFGGGGILGELISKEGLLMVAGAFAAPMVADYVQETIMPSATGWTKVAVKAAVVVAGAYAIDRFLKMRKAALAFGVTGAAVVASDAVNIARGVMKGLSASEADLLANRPDIAAQIAAGNLGGAYEAGLAGNYTPGLAGGITAMPDYAPIQTLNRNSSFGSAFSPSFNQNF